MHSIICIIIGNPPWPNEGMYLCPSDGQTGGGVEVLAEDAAWRELHFNTLLVIWVFHWRILGQVDVILGVSCLLAMIWCVIEATSVLHSIWIEWSHDHFSHKQLSSSPSHLSTSMGALRSKALHLRERRHYSPCFESRLCHIWLWLGVP